MTLKLAISKALPRTLAILAVTDAVLFVGVVLAVRTQTPAATVTTRGALASGGPPLGIALGGRLIRAAARSRCWTVRYEMEACKYCRADDAGDWRGLAAALQARGCVIIVVPPYASEALLPTQLVPPSAEQEILVSMDFARRFRLSIAPTTLLFGPQGVLIWSRQGRLAAGDRKWALRAIGKALERGRN